MRRAFTLIEVLVVIALVGVLVSLLLPALGGARFRARVLTCEARLKHLGVGVELYLHDFDRRLPQATGPGFDGQDAIVGTLFGGKKGELPFFGIDQIGAERRPLNAYVLSVEVPRDEIEGVFELDAFRSAIDVGAERTGIPGFERTDSMYDLVGSSYTLNDHALDENPAADDWSTLIPPEGGRMPEVFEPTRTVLIATHTLYAFDDGGDRRMDWWGESRRGGSASESVVRANVLFLDLHVGGSLRVPGLRGSAGHSTRDYTFLPRPDWVERYPWD